MSSRDAIAGDELFEHAGWVRRLALRLVRDAAGADDLVQDAFIAALERKPEAERALEPWLAGVVRRRASFLARSRVRRTDREAESAKSEETRNREGTSADDLIQRGELHRRVANAVMELREPYRSVLLLRFFEDLVPGEIARRLELPAGTVRSQLKRGLAELRATLETESESDQRAWSLALIPLAVDEAARHSWVTISVLTPILIMHTLVKVALPLAIVVLGTAAIRELFVSPIELDSFEEEPHTIASELSDLEPVEEQISSDARSEEIAMVVGESRRQVLSTAPRVVIPTGPLTGQIVAVDTEESVPDFAIEVYLRDEKLERLQSDSFGQFEGVGNYIGGEYQYTVVDREGVSLNWQLGGLDTSISREPHTGVFEFQPTVPLTIAVDVGPTYSLQLVGAREARLAEYSASLTGPDFYTGESNENGFWTSAALRREGRATSAPWVRFQPAEDRLSTKDGPWRLGLESLDGLWIGEAEVEPGNGVHEALVVVEVAPAAQVVVELSIASGLLPRKAQVVLSALSDTTNRRMLSHQKGSMRFAVGGVPPGEYKLSAQADNGEPSVAILTVMGGELIQRAIVLADRDTTAFLRGELRSETGTYNQTATIFAHNLEEEGISRSVIADWKLRDGNWIALFAFEDLPPARYEVLVFNWKDERAWADTPLVIDAPAEELILTCLDLVRLREFRFRVRVAAGEAEPEYVEIATVGDGHARTDRQAFGEDFVFEGIPEDVELEWCFRAKGFAPVWGSSSETRSRSVAAEELIELRPGWGARLSITTLSEFGAEPITGVKVYGDDALLGQTDLAGIVELRLDTEPMRLKFEHPRRADFAVRAGDWDRESGQLVGHSVLHRIEMGP